VSWTRADEKEQAVNGTTYRGVYFLAGPFPDNAMQGRLMVITEEYVKLRYPGVQVLDQEFFDEARAAKIYGGERPHSSWAMRITWKKLSGGTPLAFFTGPAGLITLGIIAAIVLIIGIVITARIVEKLAPDIPGTVFSPAGIIAIIIVIALLTGAMKKGSGP